VTVGSSSSNNDAYAIIPSVHPVPRRFRLAKTLREFLPANPLQIIFLLSAVCLAACFGRSWLVLPSLSSLDAVGPLTREDLGRWVQLTQLFAFPLLLSGAGAYYCCFFQRENPMKYWRRLVIAPALLGIAGGLFVPALIVLNSQPRSVLDQNGRNPLRGLKLPLRALILNSGTGFQLAVLGLILSLLAALLLRARKAALPVQFGPPPLPTTQEAFGSPIPRQKIFAVYVLTFFGLVGGLVSLPSSSILLRFFDSAWPTKVQQSFSSWFFGAQSLLSSIPLFLLALWTLDKNRRARLREAAHRPPARILGLALALPVAVYWFPRVVAYAIDRIAWAQHWNSSVTAPPPGLYFHIPALGPHLLLYALVAAFSEWSWRGCVQPQFIGTFGVSRGIFLLGILYGSVQSLSFPAVIGGLPGFFVHLVLQLVWGIVWSIIFGWLTLSAASVWPAVLFAALSSMLAHAAMTDVQDLTPRQFLRLTWLGCGCVIAFLMARYWPVAPEIIAEGQPSAQNP
jgi:hypothetical protein